MRIQDCYNRVSISKKLQEYIGSSSDQLYTDNINSTDLYAKVGDVYLCMPQTGV